MPDDKPLDGLIRSLSGDQTDEAIEKENLFRWINNLPKRRDPIKFHPTPKERYPAIASAPSLERRLTSE